MIFSNLADRIGIDIQNLDLYREAFTHKSFANEHKNEKDNERLEFLGDAVLELVVTEFLFAEFPSEPEGKMTKLRSALVSGASLAVMAKKMNLGEFLFLSRGEEASGGRKKNPILANVMEALIGALYLDLGMSVAADFIHTNLLPRLPEILEKNLHKDPKSAYQEWAQEKHDITPEYKVLNEEGPDHKKIFTVGVFLGRKKMAEGKGSSKQKAEVNAAENALESV
jgi:ribonuclease-3